MISQLKSAGCLVASLLPLTSAPALAAPPNHSASIALLGLTGQELSPGALADIRGGFDFNRAFSISFGFRQEETINGIVVKSIEVPTINLTATTDTGVLSTNTAQAGIQVTNASGQTQTITPSSHGAINITTQGNNGLTIINTQLDTSGITNTTTNTANNTAISVAATADIGISGLTQLLNQQQSFANARSGMYYGGSAFR